MCASAAPLLPPLPNWAYKLGHISAPLKAHPQILTSLPPRSDLAGNPLLVQHEQTAHPLCMDGQYGLRLCWLRRLKLGFGKLLASSLTASPLTAAAKSAASVASAAIAATTSLAAAVTRKLRSDRYEIFQARS